VLQRKLAIGSSHDPLERQADQVADRVLADPASGDFTTIPVTFNGNAPAGIDADVPPRVHSVLAQSGRPIEMPIRRDMEARFGRDFSQLRIHDGAEAGQSARDVNASAYAVGPNIAFAPGRYAPFSSEGRRLLAHELAHFVQHGNAAPILRRQAEGSEEKSEKHLKDYNDKDPKHDPSKLTDAEIEETAEFKAYMDPTQTWQSKYKVTRQQALLASRLMLRRLREGKEVEGDSGTLKVLRMARRQLGVLDAATDNVGNFKWTHFQNKEAVEGRTSTMESDFARWLLAKGQEPDAATAKINCWEMILLSAFQAKYVTKERLETMYVDGVVKMKAGRAKVKENAAKPGSSGKQQDNPGAEKDAPITNMGQVFEASLRGSKEYVWDPTKPNSPEPLPGDIIIFNEANTHVAISVGTTTKGKGGTTKHHIISHGLHPDRKNMTKRTTIEELLEFVPKPTVVKFWRPNW
jgi:hypothetical protein